MVCQDRGRSNIVSNNHKLEFKINSCQLKYRGALNNSYKTLITDFIFSHKGNEDLSNYHREILKLCDMEILKLQRDVGHRRFPIEIEQFHKKRYHRKI